MDFDIVEDKIQLERNGKKVDCDILFTFDSEDTLKSYIGYTDNSIAANGRKNIYVSSYNPLQTEMKLEDVTDSKELEMVCDVLKQIDKNSNQD